MNELVDLINIVNKLKNEYGLVSLKGGTEVEDMTFNEIKLLKEIAGDLPVIVKIGGPEARNDIRMLKNMGIDGILAPMIESEYGLENFVETIIDIYDNSLPYLAINIETITAYKNLKNIFNNNLFDYISQVTVGRSDLSRSMKKNIEDNDVFKKSKDIVNLAKKFNKITSIGGTITPLSAVKISNQISPDKINTRHLTFSLNKTANIFKSILFGLEFEIKLYQYFSKTEPAKYKTYQKRINTTLERIA